MEIKTGMPLHEVEKLHIVNVLDFFKGNKVLAAKTLGVSTKTLYNKLHVYGLSDKYITRKVVNETTGS